MDVEFECINNGDYAVGNTYALPFAVGLDNGARGFAEEMDYSFGLQAKSKVKLGSCANVACHKVTVIYKYGNTEVQRQVFTVPEGYDYSIDTVYVRKVIGGYEYVFRPTAAKVEGTMGNADVTANVNLAVALLLNLDTRVLTIVSVDDFERTPRTQSGETIYTLEIE